MNLNRSRCYVAIDEDLSLVLTEGPIRNIYTDIPGWISLGVNTRYLIRYRTANPGAYVITREGVLEPVSLTHPWNHHYESL